MLCPTSGAQHKLCLQKQIINDIHTYNCSTYYSADSCVDMLFTVNGRKSSHQQKYQIMFLCHSFILTSNYNLKSAWQLCFLFLRILILTKYTQKTQRSLCSVYLTKSATLKLLCHQRSQNQCYIRIKILYEYITCFWTNFPFFCNSNIGYSIFEIGRTNIIFCCAIQTRQICPIPVVGIDRSLGTTMSIYVMSCL